MPGKVRRSLNKKKLICGQCKLQVLDDDDAIQCDACEKTLHSFCTKLDKKQYDKLLKNNSLIYNCHLCDDSNNNSSESSSVNMDLLEIKTKLKQLDQLDELIKTMQFMSSQYDSILKGVATNKKTISNLQKENNLLRQEIRHINSSVKYLKDEKVKNDCIINGVVIGKEINAINAVLDIAHKIGADIKADNISEAYVLSNKSKKEENGRRAVVVKFISKIHKDKFMAEKRKLKQNNELKHVFINDFLSSETMKLYNYAKSVKKVGYKFVFSRGSKIFVRKNEDSAIITIRSMDDVDKLLMKASNNESGKSTSDHVSMNNYDWEIEQVDVAD